MGRLFLVRHGQASALSGDYDQLSTLGREQARLLASHFDRFDIVPDRVLVGPRRRHIQTHEETLSAIRSRERWPVAQHVPELDEHHAVQLVVHLGPTLHAREDELGSLARAAYGGDHDIKRAMGRLFQHVIPAWVRGDLSHPEVEPFIDFKARVSRFLESARAFEGTTVAFTSGGAISAAVAEAQGLDEERTLDVMWHLLNASITELVIRDRRITLAALNGTPHLTEARLLTHI
jgi:broad specificity phosphatase PhoE